MAMRHYEPTTLIQRGKKMYAESRDELIPYLDRKIEKHLITPIDEYVNTAIRSTSILIPRLLALMMYLFGKFNSTFKKMPQINKKAAIYGYYINAMTDINSNIDRILQNFRTRYRIPQELEREFRQRIMVHILKKTIQAYLVREGKMPQTEPRTIVQKLNRAIQGAQRYCQGSADTHGIGQIGLE